MPDFDIDFCQERREEVIRYVQEKYGRTELPKSLPLEPYKHAQHCVMWVGYWICRMSG